MRVLCFGERAEWKKVLKPGGEEADGRHEEYKIRS